MPAARYVRHQGVRPRARPEVVESLALRASAIATATPPMVAKPISILRRIVVVATRSATVPTARPPALLAFAASLATRAMAIATVAPPTVAKPTPTPISTIAVIAALSAARSTGPPVVRVVSVALPARLATAIVMGTSAMAANRFFQPMPRIAEVAPPPARMPMHQVCAVLLPVSWALAMPVTETATVMPQTAVKFPLIQPPTVALAAMHALMPMAQRPALQEVVYRRAVRVTPVATAMPPMVANKTPTPT